MGQVKSWLSRQRKKSLLKQSAQSGRQAQRQEQEAEFTRRSEPILAKWVVPLVPEDRSCSAAAEQERRSMFRYRSLFRHAAPSAFVNLQVPSQCISRCRSLKLFLPTFPLKLSTSLNSTLQIPFE